MSVYSDDIISASLADAWNFSVASDEVFHSSLTDSTICVNEACWAIVESPLSEEEEETCWTPDERPSSEEVKEEKKESIRLPRYFYIVLALIAVCLFGFRRPWAVITQFDDISDFQGLDPKIWLSISHFSGVATGKLATIFVSARTTKHLLIIPIIISLAWIALGLSGGDTTAVVMCLFVTGLAVACAEPGIHPGQSHNGILTAMLSSGYGIGSGLSKFVGANLLELGVPQLWMPAASGLGYMAPTLLVLYLVSKISPPQVKNKDKKLPQSQNQLDFIQKFWPGMILLFLMEFMTFTLVSVRDIFQSDIWSEIFPKDQVNSSIYLSTEYPVTIFTILSVCFLSWIKSSYLSSVSQHLLFVWCGCTMLVAQNMFEANLLSARIWYILIGGSSLLAYVAIRSILVHRLFGSSRIVSHSMNISSILANVGASIVLYLLSGKTRVYLISCIVYCVAIGLIITSFLSALYWRRKHIATSRYKRKMKEGPTGSKFIL